VLPRSRLQSGQETPLQYATEDTPAVFSRNDSLSSLEFDEGAGTGLPGTKGNAINQFVTEELRRTCGKDCEGFWHRLINHIDTKAKCRHLKKMTCKGVFQS
jgi:hypothetical protein